MLRFQTKNSNSLTLVTPHTVFILRMQDQFNSKKFNRHFRSETKNIANVSPSEFNHRNPEFCLRRPHDRCFNSLYYESKLFKEANNQKFASDWENILKMVEPIFDSIPNQETFLTRRSNYHSSLHYEDALSDFSLETFDRVCDKTSKDEDILDVITLETTSLSDFYNVSDVMLNIKERLESCLKVNEDKNQTVNRRDLEENIAVLKSELERYLQIINEKKENELRKFSENMINHSSILHVKNAFYRKEKLKSQRVYESLEPTHRKYISANSEYENQSELKLRNFYDDDYNDFNQLYYTMIIDEEKSEKLLNDVPPLKTYNEREQTSLALSDSEKIIMQWQKYQQISLNHKNSPTKKWNKSKIKPRDVWGLTLDYNQNRLLLHKLRKEKRLR